MIAAVSPFLFAEHPLLLLFAVGLAAAVLVPWSAVGTGRGK